MLNHATVEEFEKEIRAQIDKAQAVGITPTHLDSHMGTCFYEPFIESYVKVGIEKKIPVLMIGGHMQYAGPEVGKFTLLLRPMGETGLEGGSARARRPRDPADECPRVRAEKAAVAPAAHAT